MCGGDIVLGLVMEWGFSVWEGKRRMEETRKFWFMNISFGGKGVCVCVGGDIVLGLMMEWAFIVWEGKRGMEEKRVLVHEFWGDGGGRYRIGADDGMGI